jgi:hypothetical protein
LTCYQILGLRPGASPDQVHRAYKQLALRHHPDRSCGDPESHKLFCQVTEAYARLKSLFVGRTVSPNVGVCPKCDHVAELYLGLDRRRYCATCLLYSRRRFLPLPTFQKLRCVAAMSFQALALYCIILAGVTGDWQPGAAGVMFTFAAMAAMAFDFLRADLIEV